MRNLILGLVRPLLRLLGRDERGAVAVIVALLLGTGVLTGIGALVGLSLGWLVALAVKHWTPIAAAMKTKTPKAPDAFKMKAMMKEEKITDSRLHE